MKRLIIFILLFVSVFGFSQTEDGTLRLIDWKTVVKNVVLVNDSTYIFDADPIDLNDKGAMEREIGNYFVDFVGNRYKIIDSTLTTITVLDEYRKNVAPQSDQLGRVYQSVGEGEMEYVGGVDLTVIDELSKWKVQAADNQLWWELINGRSPFVGVVKEPTIDKNIDGTLTIHDDGIYIFNDQTDGKGKSIKIENIADTTLTITDKAVSYIYVNYNGGNPTYTYTFDNAIFLNNFTYQPVDRVIKDGTELFTEKYGDYAVLLANKHIIKDVILNSFQRQSGLLLSTTGTRISNISAGSAWFSINRITLDANISGSVGSLYEYYLTSGVWNYQSVTSYDASYYSDGTNRQPLSNNKYVAKYFFRDVGSDNEAYYFHGNQYNTLAEARAELMPTPPSLVVSHSIYVGKIVIQKGALDGVAFPRVWEGQVQSATSTSHTDLTASSLAWTASGHTGNNNTIAVFNNEGVASTIIDSSAFWNNHLRQDKDTSITNEIQTLSTNGTAGNISISPGNTITLNVNDADYSPTNELQNLTYQRYSDKGIMNISSGNSDTIPIVDDTYAGLMTPEQKAKLDSTVSNSNPLFYVEGDLQTNIIYGYLYNWYAATDAREIANTGWHVSTTTELTILRDYLGGQDIAGGHMKETGTTYWLSPNTGATNSSKFNGRGAGRRVAANGIFNYINSAFSIISSNTISGFATGSILVYNHEKFSVANIFVLPQEGMSVRLIKDSTTLSHGETGTYTGNDGKIYRTICIGTQEWLADNLAETKYRNGDSIPEVTDNTTWAGLTTGARCSYNNDEANALTIVNGTSPIYQGDSTNFTTPEILSDSLDNYWSKEEILPQDTANWNEAYSHVALDKDTSITNELITSVTYDNDTLTITEAGTEHKVEIAASSGCNQTVQTLSGSTDTLNVANGVNGYLDISGNTTIRIEPTANCNTGNITVLCEAAADSITFTSSYTLKVSPYLDLSNGKIPVTNGADAIDVYSYWFDGTRLVINGTKGYE